MSRGYKQLAIAGVLFLAFALAGFMDKQDAECSWNGCGDARYETKEN